MQQDKPVWPCQSQCHTKAKLYTELRPEGACKTVTIDDFLLKAKKNKADGISVDVLG